VAYKVQTEIIIVLWTLSVYVIIFLGIDRCLEDVNNGIRSTLTMDSVTKDDGGIYECMVKNEYLDLTSCNSSKSR